MRHKKKRSNGYRIKWNFLTFLIKIFINFMSISKKFKKICSTSNNKLKTIFSIKNKLINSSKTKLKFWMIKLKRILFKKEFLWSFRIIKKRINHSYSIFIMNMKGLAEIFHYWKIIIQKHKIKFQNVLKYLVVYHNK